MARTKTARDSTKKLLRAQDDISSGLLFVSYFVCCILGTVLCCMSSIAFEPLSLWNGAKSSLTSVIFATQARSPNLSINHKPLRAHRSTNTNSMAARHEMLHAGHRRRGSLKRKSAAKSAATHNLQWQGGKIRSKRNGCATGCRATHGQAVAMKLLC